MPLQQISRNGSLRFAIVALMVAALTSPTAWAGNFFRNGAVGGVAIDVKGVLTQPSKQMTRQIVEAMKDVIQDADGEMAEASPLRRISLRQLADTIAEADANNYDLPIEVKHLAGMQRVKYVFVYPEQRDIVLAGPGEGWKVTEQGAVVGRTNGLPMLTLDDLLVAFRTTQQARQGGISCSIDPSEVGIRRMNALVSKQRSFNRNVLPKIEKALGPQQIKLSGLPTDSHSARVMVAADYFMKRIAMDLEPSPLRELPSYLDMMARSRVKLTNMMPRWWLACDYEPLARTEDGLGWELRGPGVKVMTETDFVAADGSREATGRKGDLAQKWADTMTAHYDELSVKRPVFGQLRNLMDLCVIAAVIDQHNLIEQAGCDLSALTGDTVTIDSYNTPRSVSTQCSFAKRGREYLITASGGVQIDSWQVASKSQVDTGVAQVHQKATKTTDRWWQ